MPRNRYVTYLAIALAGFAADLATKEATFRWLGVHPHFVAADDPAAIARWRGDPGLNHLWWLWEGRLGIQTSLNEGALFGMGAGYWWLFATLSIVALAGVSTWLFAFKAALDRWINVALAFVTAGILGNLYDRLGLFDSTGLDAKFHHAVRDWILFVWPESGMKMFNPWPNFNIADSLLVTGAIMLVVHAVVWREKKEDASDKSERTAA
ncbi:MAG TPA: signal peptidase II [Pirellulaceae bacterium]|nr:signal peptidase II [Pirellulaceae bacterium]